MKQPCESAQSTVDFADEDLGVGGSIPSARTIFPATVTPEHIALRMVAMAGIEDGMTVLVPGAGWGALVLPARAAGACVTCVESNAARAGHLHDLKLAPLATDFLALPARDAYDRILVNPPLRTVPFLKHACRFLKRGGRLVALVHRHALSEPSLSSGPDHQHAVGAVYLDERFEFDGAPVEAAILTVDRL